MNVTITPSKAFGEVFAPPSKSFAHRLLIGAALSDGVSVIENIGSNDDILATVSCLRNLGAQIEVNGSVATVKGIDTDNIKDEVSLYCNESGSTLRFLIPVGLMLSKKAVFTGSGRLMERPQTVYEDVFRNKNCTLTKSGDAITVFGDLFPGVFELKGDVSSQFITGLMFVLPLLKGDSEIVLTTPLQSEPYVNITIEVLKEFGITVNKTDKGYFVKGNQKYVPGNIVCQGDWSNAAFLDAFNLSGGNVKINGLNVHSTQGDKVYVDYYNELSKGEPVLDISQCPDLGPVLMVCACLKNGGTLIGTTRLKIKESDRGEAMKQELLKFGICVETGDDYIKIPKSLLKQPQEPLDCHNDHRIAMSLAILCSVTGGTLIDAQCVNKSYPDFFDVIENLGIHINRRCQK